MNLDLVSLPLNHQQVALSSHCSAVVNCVNHLSVSNSSTTECPAGVSAAVLMA